MGGGRGEEHHHPRVFLRDSAGAISPFHDIPYRAGANTFHAVIEVPR